MFDLPAKNEWPMNNVTLENRGRGEGDFRLFGTRVNSREFGESKVEGGEGDSGGGQNSNFSKTRQFRSKNVVQYRFETASKMPSSKMKSEIKS